MARGRWGWSPHIKGSRKLIEQAIVPTSTEEPPLPSHTLPANPDECAGCKVMLSSGYSPKAAAGHHGYAQDDAIARAVRAAAGSENPVKWVLNEDRSATKVFGDWCKVFDALRREQEDA